MILSYTAEMLQLLLYIAIGEVKHLQHHLHWMDCMRAPDAWRGESVVLFVKAHVQPSLCVEATMIAVEATVIHQKA
eukprot:SAG31_NODE_2185_length_6243_cov_3.811035_1_plen_75_part_10